MKITTESTENGLERRRRLHEIIVALIHQQVDLQLMDPDDDLSKGYGALSLDDKDPAKWLSRNKKILKTYQALVRSAMTLDALVDSECN